jgi:cytochrome c oxidase subunit II
MAPGEVWAELNESDSRVLHRTVSAQYQWNNCMNLEKDLTPEGWHGGECARIRRSATFSRLKRMPLGVGKRLFFKFATSVLLAGLPGIALAEDLPIRSVQNIFTPKSGPAETLFWLAVLVLSICAVIFLVVGGLLTYAVIRYRRRGPGDDESEPPQVYGGAAIELAWTVMPILIVVVLVLVTARTIGEITRPQPGGSSNEELRIIGHRFWWEVRYPKHDVVTANEIHVPVDSRDQPALTEITLESADVAHGFWVPELNGKTWAVPNYRNTMWIKPFERAIYFGNCTVLCGDQHANMLIRVFVQDRKDYDQWLENQKKPPVADPAVAEGLKEFVANSCGTCHTIATTAANGVFGPDLTHFMSRTTLGAGVAANNEENLRSWLKDPQVLKPGCLMPNMKLDDKQVDEIFAYLRTLK